jgi:hypothetical protein
VQTLWKLVLRFLKKLKIELPYDPTILLQGLQPKECKTAYNRDTCTTVFIAALFMIAKLWNQTWCPSVKEWMKKLWCIFTMEYYSTIKKNKIMSFAGK